MSSAPNKSRPDTTKNNELNRWTSAISIEVPDVNFLSSFNK